MKIVNFATRRPVSVIVIVTVILILGFFSFSRTSVDLLPEMNFPMAAVITSYSGAGPEEVESQITKTMEGSLNSLSGITEIQSTSSEGSSVVLIMFDWGTNMDSAMLDIRENISFIESFLPTGAGKPMVVKMDPNMMPIMQIGVSGGENLEQLQDIAEDVIEPRLSRIPEIASVYITGGNVRQVSVEVDPVKLENYKLSLAQVVSVLQAENFNMSGGQYEQGQRKYYVRNLQQFETTADIEDVRILTSTGQALRLADIAVIKDGYEETTQYTRVNGEPAVGIHCMKQTGANTVSASKQVLAELDKIEQELNMGLEINVVMDQAEYIKQSIQNTEKMILEGALLAILVIFLFLRNWRSTFIIFISIPVSIITTFILMYFSNASVNLITMGGLALGVGRIVDDSIVVFENIYRHRQLGETRMLAAQKGASEVGGAVIAATLTIIAVFAPIAYVQGLTAILFRPLAIVICCSIVASLFVSLTIIPLLASRMLTDETMEKLNKLNIGEGRKVTDRFSRWLDGLSDRYSKLLQASLKRRRRVMVIVTLMMVASLALIPLVGAEFMPAMDTGEISINIEMDKGSTISSTEEVSAQVEERLRSIPEMDLIFASIGSSSVMLMGSGSHTDVATMYVKLCPRNERSKDVNEMTDDIRKMMSDIPGAKIEVSVMDSSGGMMSGSSSAITIQVTGDDLQVLKDLSTEIAEVVRNVPGTREVVSSLTDGTPELQIHIDRDRAAAYGLTPMQVSSTINSAMQGTVATQYRVEGEEVDVKVLYASDQVQDIDYLKNLSIYNSMGMSVKLSQIASFTVEQGPISISRLDQVRIANISGSLLNRDLKSVMDDIKTGVDKIQLPAGYEVEYAGQNQQMMDTFGDLALALLLAIILVYAVMAVQYESFFSPFVIMFSVPTAIIGIIIALLLTGRALSVPAFIGMIMLVGVAVSNAIVFVDYLKQQIDKGMDRDEAIVETGRVRLRPILMTAFSTILAMVPLALGMGEGGEYQAPLATVVIGGLLISTLITLVLVPVVYSILDDIGRRRRQKKADRKAVSTELSLD
ncbi:rnd multidrug efflux transporter [hydrocarbon metagenome]|uniref:Rnd multidrug efflux transporter n=1 Tax=hydrocarbon metagenome TaxID=938273 RepID=A0A0W8E1I8_9ZZZZ